MKNQWCHAQRDAKVTARREFSLFREVHWIPTEFGYCSVLSLSCPNHSGGQLKRTGWVLNFGTINCSTTLCSNHGGVFWKLAKAGLAPRVNLVILASCIFWILFSVLYRRLFHPMSLSFFNWQYKAISWLYFHVHFPSVFLRISAKSIIIYWSQDPTLPFLRKSELLSINKIFKYFKLYSNDWKKLVKI